MKPVYRGVAVAVFECLMVLSLAGKYAIDRERLPRAWARALPVDPNLPIRGRYVSLRLKVDLADGTTEKDLHFDSANGRTWVQGSVLLSAQNGRLVVTPVVPFTGSGNWVLEVSSQEWELQPPVTFFIPEHVPDPSRRAAGEELWVEVSVPHKGPPRPVRLGVKKDGVLTPLAL